MKRWIGFGFLMVVMMYSPSARAMDNPRVRDDGAFFSPDAISRANDQIKRIKQTYGKDVYVETWPSVPADQRDQLKSMGNDKFFADALRRRAADEKVDGVIVLISREPSHLHVGMGANTKIEAFSIG